MSCQVARACTIEGSVVARPIVKWAGGKSRLLAELRRHVPREMETYAEPFCGGAALYFALASGKERPFRRALLADKNAELVATYCAIRDDVDAVIDALKDYKYDRDLFYRIRELDTSEMTGVARAARLIFLNKTCFNGLWRVNAAGKFNVPFGRYKSPRILDEAALRAASRALAGAEIVHGDFTSVTRELGAGDFVYFDPPYVPLSKTASFTSYAVDRFGPAEQERLVAELHLLRARGARAMLSNAYNEETARLYAEFAFHVIDAPRSINSDPTKRQSTRELIVTTWEKRARRRERVSRV